MVQTFGLLEAVDGFSSEWDTKDQEKDGNGNFKTHNVQSFIPTNVCSSSKVIKKLKKKTVLILLQVQVF